jgi:hypothetical protein
VDGLQPRRWQVPDALVQQRRASRPSGARGALDAARDAGPLLRRRARHARRIRAN